MPGAGEYSMMNVFARFGFDVWTMDFEGYGHSTVTEGNSDIKSGVADLKAAIEVRGARDRRRRSASFIGESSGALRAGAFADGAARARRPAGAGGAHLYRQGLADAWPSAPSRSSIYRTHNRRTRDRAMIESIFTRDKPGTADPRVAAAMADGRVAASATRCRPAPIST